MVLLLTKILLCIIGTCIVAFCARYSYRAKKLEDKKNKIREKQNINIIDLDKDNIE